MKKEFFKRFSPYLDERKQLRAEGGDEPDDCLKGLLDALILPMMICLIT